MTVLAWVAALLVLWSVARWGIRRERDRRFRKLPEYLHLVVATRALQVSFGLALLPAVTAAARVVADLATAWEAFEMGDEREVPA